MGSIFVGNIAWRVTEQELGDAFANYGPVSSVKIIQDRETGRSKGFGFVEYSDSGCIDQAIQNMNGFELGGRQLRVNAANQRN
jgi:RNA recognition motif-containing protein